MSERGPSPRGIRRAVLTLAALAWPIVSLAAPRETKPLYTLDRQTMPHIDAVEYTLKDEASHIFAVPERNAVGTNSYRNAITILDLSGTKVKYREVRRNFKTYVSGGEMVLLPEFSPDTIGYSQTRGFLLFNVKNGEFKHQLISRALEESIQDVAVLDWKRKLFLFSIEFIADSTPEREVQVVDLSGPEPLVTAHVGIKKEPLNAQLGRTTFYFTEHGGRRVLHALDERLQEVKHPLLGLYNAAHLFGGSELPRLHPSLPAALVWAEDATDPEAVSLWAVTWKADRAEGGHQDPELHKLLGYNLAGNFRYSPDGKWVAFIDTTPHAQALGVMPIDPSLPQVFGSPILLATGETIPEKWNGNCAWISDPVSVVCSINRSEYIRATDQDREINKLLKWELSPGNIKK